MTPNRDRPRKLDKSIIPGCPQVMQVVLNYARQPLELRTQNSGAALGQTMITMNTMTIHMNMAHQTHQTGPMHNPHNATKRKFWRLEQFLSLAATEQAPCTSCLKQGDKPSTFRMGRIKVKNRHPPYRPKTCPVFRLPRGASTNEEP